MTDENRRRNVVAEWKHVADSLAAVRALVAARLPNDAVSKAYYAAFHAAAALLLTLGLEPKTHAGTGTLLGRHFEDKLGAGLVSDFGRLQTFRHAADYDRETNFTMEEADAETRRAEAFVAKAEVLLHADGWLAD